jgi:hypothetical protein
MKKKATSSSSHSIWAETERRIVQGYSEIQAIWYRSLDLQVDLSRQLQSKKKVSEKILEEISNEFGSMLKKLRECFGKVRPYLSEADSKYTIFSDLEDLIAEYLESLKLLPKDKDVFLGRTGHKNTRYTFWNLAYCAERQIHMRIKGELVLFVSPLANLLNELLEDMPCEYTDAEVDFLITQRVKKERDYLLLRLPGVVPLVVSKPKKSRSQEAIQKENDLLYLLDQYESWKAKTTEKTRRKRLNSKDWLECRKQWPEKTEKLFVKYADQLLDDEIEIENLLDNARHYRKRRKKGAE